uniref:SURF1-like protein n=1 Tax=Strongyloides venezuelensis TaxID=75913 RepID=A0A0K0FK35_STRVS
MFTKYECFSKTLKHYNIVLCRNSSRKSENILNLKEKHTLKYNNRKKDTKKKLTFGSIAMLIVPAFTFSLGCWQVQRWFWKKNIINELENQMGKKCVEFPFDDLSKLDDMEYMKVKVEGKFIHEKEFLIYPRGRFDKEFKKSDSSGIVASNNMSSSGAHVITPLKIKDRNMIIMVNRGWVPKDRMSKDTRLDTFPKEYVKLSGIVRKSENRPQFVSENLPDKGIWFYKNFEQMGKYCGALPIYIEATEEHSYLPNGPISGQSNVEIRNKHVEYFLTWYSLTALTVVMWYMRFLK